MSATPANIVCNRCGQSSSGVAHCPDRASRSCPFEIVSKKPVLTPIFVAILLIFPLLCLGFRDCNVLLLILLAATAIALVSREVLFYNVAAHTKLCRITFLGLEMFHEWTLREKLVPLDLTPPAFLTFPASIAALAPLQSVTPDPTPALPVAPVASVDLTSDAREVAKLVRAALLHLISTEQVQVYAAPSYAYRIWENSPSVKDIYIISNTSETDLQPDAGELERKIMSALTGWSRSADFKEWRAGPPVFQLVCALYPGQVSSAPRWLARIVAEDAEARNLCQFRHKFASRENIVWDPLRQGEIWQAHNAVATLSERLRHVDTHFSLTLDEQIEEGIKKMEDDGGGY